MHIFSLAMVAIFVCIMAVSSSAKAGCSATHQLKPVQSTSTVFAQTSNSIKPRTSQKIKYLIHSFLR